MVNNDSLTDPVLILYEYNNNNQAIIILILILICINMSNRHFNSVINVTQAS